MNAMVRRAGLVLLLGIFFTGTAFADSVTERFSSARLQFEYKNFSKAIELLDSLLYPQVQLTSEQNIVKAREMLGLAYFYTGRKDKAREEFKALLYLRPKHRLDSFLVPPPAVRFFDEIWKDPKMKDRLDQIERERIAAQRAAEKKQKHPSVVRRIYLERTITQKSYVMVFLPFGMGQFQNGDTALGITLASTQGLALLANMLSWSLRWGLEEKGGGYTDPSIAEGLRMTQYASLGVFVGLYIYGVIDAWVDFQPQVVEPFQRVREEVQSPNSSGGDSTGSDSSGSDSFGGDSRDKASDTRSFGSPGTSTVIGPGLFSNGAGLQVLVRF